MSLLLGRRAVGSILYIVTGSAGVGIFWDRWSSRVGHQDQIDVLFSGEGPTTREVVMLSTHGPLLLVGLLILALMLGRRFRESETSLEKNVDIAPTQSRFGSKRFHREGADTCRGSATAHVSRLDSSSLLSWRFSLAAKAAVGAAVNRDVLRAIPKTSRFSLISAEAWRPTGPPKQRRPGLAGAR